MESKAEEKKKSLGERLFGGDGVLWIIITALLILSMLVVYSSTIYKESHGFLKQIFFLALGFVVLLFGHRVRYQLFYKWAAVIFGAAVVLQLMTFFIGTEINGEKRWLAIPFTGLTFQPSDVLKIALVMFLARQLARRQRTIDRIPILPSLSPRDWMRHRDRNLAVLKETTLPLLLPIAVSCVLVMPTNLSTAAILFFTSWLMLFIGRVKGSELARLLAVIVVPGLLVVGVMIAFGIGRGQTWGARLGIGPQTAAEAGGAERAQEARAAAAGFYYNAGEDPQETNAKIAVATGGVVGKGPGMSTQRSNLANSESDYAYSFVVEEYGLAGGVLVLALFLWIFFRSILVFKRCGTAFPSLLVLGLGLMITFQAMIHMLVAVTIFPVTGQPLPIISKGGTSLLFTLIALAIILGISRQTEENTLDKPAGESMLERGGK